MKSVISATASGWLSLTPRSSRRRATIAAMAISSLSFSRGVRFMRLDPSVEPEPRQRRRASAASTATRSCAQRRAVRRAKPRDGNAVPGRDADLAAESSAERAHRRDVRFVARARSARSRPRRRRWRPPARRAARRSRRRAAGLGDRSSRPSRRTRQRSTSRPCAPPRPWRRGRTRRLRRAAARRRRRGRPRCVRASRARSNRIVSCGSQASARAGGDRQA